MKAFSKSWYATVVHYSTLAWTVFCIIGTWFVILKYGILMMGLSATVITFVFAAAIWMIPFAGLILLSLYVTPPEDSPPLVPFRELIKKGMRRSNG